MDRAAAEHDRASAAITLLTRHGPALRRAARRVSLCAEDADDALQRAIEIALTKAPPLERGRLIAWMIVVTKHEALAVRRARERLLAPRPPATEWPERDPLDVIASEAPGPAERLVRDERVAHVRRALAALKPAERLAILLQAEGHSYAEIAALCGWTYTKVNRSLSEGRARLRSSLRSS